METQTNLRVRNEQTNQVPQRHRRPVAQKTTAKTKAKSKKISILDIAIILLIIMDITLSGAFAYYFYNNILL